MKKYKPRVSIKTGRPDDPPPLTNVRNKDYIPSYLRKGFDEKKVIKLPPNFKTIQKEIK